MKRNLFILIFFVIGLCLRQVDSTSAFFGDTQSTSFEARAATWPVIELTLRSDRKAVGFWVGAIKEYKSLTYLITYTPINREPQGIYGSLDLSGQDSESRDDLIMGTNSSGAWVYDRGMEKIKLQITLSGNGSPLKTLETEIDY